MTNYFNAGPDMVRWHLTQVDAAGFCRLEMRHARGVIVEYFDTSQSALLRVQELEELFNPGRTGSRSLPTGRPS